MLGTGFRQFLATVLTVVAAMAPSIAHSQVRYPIDLPPQSLEDSLKAIARITGTNVLFEPQLVRGKSGGAVKGNLTTEEAVSQALRGTSLEARRSTDNTLILREKGSERASDKASDSGDAGIQKLDSIRVTAQKRDERLVDVPQSVAVVTAQDIDRRHIVSAEDYLRGIPGVNQVGQGGLGTAIQIRGIETAPYPYFQNFTSGPSVATYFGETPTTNSAGLAGGSNIDLKVVDVERVEVLRGPQGTAFGSSAMGGAVRTIPVAPKLGVFEGSASASYSVTSGTGGDNYSGQAVLNMPLVEDKLALRGVAYHYQDSGYYRNVARSDPAFLAAVTAQGAEAFAQDQDEVGSVRFDGGRIAANYRASDSVKFLFTYLKQRSRLDGQANSTKAGYEQAVLQVAPEHVVRGRPEGVFDTDVDLFSATADIDLRMGSLLATYSRVESNARYSSPRTAQAGNQPYSQLGKSDHNADSGEIRFVSRLDGPWNFLAGLYGENLEDAGSFNFVWYGSLASLPPGFGAARFLGEQRDTRKLRQNAAFGEVSWEILPKLTLTAGARYYDYKRTGRLENEGGPFIGGNTSTTTEVNENGSRYRANLSYKPDDDSIAYVSFAQGFRLGKPQVPLQPGACDTNSDDILDGT
ncbi:MAG TPA: TonB-dependent receptor, partial [Usitatibacter sp.]|nr:TonB-dependent receptor [Usitatibacter sp.]